MLLVVIADQLLIQGKIDLMGGNGALVVLRNIDLMDDLVQRCEILLNGLIHQNIAVRQIQDLLLHPALQEAVYDLEGSIGFARTGGHHQQQALLPAGNCVQGAVDGNALIVARRIGVLAAVIGLTSDRLLGRCNAGLLIQTGKELCLRRELV